MSPSSGDSRQTAAFLTADLLSEQEGETYVRGGWPNILRGTETYFICGFCDAAYYHEPQRLDNSNLTFIKNFLEDNFGYFLHPSGINDSTDIFQPNAQGLLVRSSLENLPGAKTLSLNHGYILRSGRHGVEQFHT